MGGNFIPCWFSLNDSETVKALTHAYCSSQQHFIRDIRANLGVPNLPQSPDTGQNLHEGNSGFRISGQSLTKENCHNSRTGDDIDMKLGTVTKLDKGNKATSRKIDDNLELSGSRISNAYSVKRTISLIATFYLTKTKKELKNL